MSTKDAVKHKIKMLHELIEGDPEITNKELAKRLGWSRASVSAHKRREGLSKTIRSSKDSNGEAPHETVSQTSGDAPTLTNLARKMRELADFTDTVVKSYQEKAEQLFL